MAKVKIMKDGHHLSRDELSVNIVGYILVGLFALVCVIPFYLIIVASFTDEASLIRNGYPLIPTDFSLQSYMLCLKNPVAILKAYGTTIGVTLVGTALAVLIATMTGYVLSRKDFPWRNKFSFFFFFTTLFSGGLVPWYMMCIRYLNFKNSYLGIILPLMFSVWNMIIAKSFMAGIPSAITESAKIDGANDMTIYVKLILPLSKPLIATLSLFAALAYWNDWMNGLYYLNDDRMFSIQVLLMNIQRDLDSLRQQAQSGGSVNTANLPSTSVRMALTVMGILPIMIIYPFMQKYFVKGIAIGAVKG